MAAAAVVTPRAMFGDVIEGPEQFLRRTERESREKRTAEDKERVQEFAARQTRGSSKVGVFQRRGTQRVNDAVKQDVEDARLSPAMNKARLGAAMQTRFAKERLTDEYRALPPRQQSNQMNRMLAEEASKLNMPVVAAAAASTYANTATAFKRETKEQRKMTLDNDAQEYANAPAQRKAKRSAAWESLQNAAVARVLPNNVYLNGGSEGVGGAILLPEPPGAIQVNGITYNGGEWSHYQDKGHYPTQSESYQKLKDTLSKGAMENLRAKWSAASAAVESYSKILDIVKTSRDADGNINILGGAGNLAAKVGRLVNNVKNLVRVTGGVYKQVGPDGEIDFNIDEMDDQGREDMVAEALGADWRERGILGDLTHEREQLTSMLVQAAYAAARAYKPSNARINTSDITNAMKALGADVTDPGSMQAILSNSVSAIGASLDREALALGQDLINHLVSPASQAKDRAARESFLDINDPLRTTAVSSPMPIHTPPAVAIQAGLDPAQAERAAAALANRPRH